MFFIKKDEIISADNFTIRKIRSEISEDFSIYLFERINKIEHVLAKFNNENGQAELFDKILQTIYDKCNYVDLTMYEK
ncbi:hypothetical protein SKUN_00342 [Spiroplasma kunkelii CR2-3x]|uniref:Uncharacterized protein n=1 Tax=Spiroplasma kunkelii CR2-3x TaxID=273035 RepID=A0A0K2JFR0_SPIKU|nr:hypothetical protein [Spiroplasma kunkelii]ALA97258.1 hypothetical protein SKUN_00342 [Spiroplasma kunkelii CR2-3x]